MAITTSSGDRYDSEENFIAGTPSEYIEMASNDNIPKSPGTTVPQIVLPDTKLPKPANDNDNRKPMKVIDVEPSMGAELKYHPEWPHSLMDLTSTDLAEVPPSKNIEDRGDYDIFDKFRYHPLFEELKKGFTTGGDNIKDNTSRLGHQLGREDFNKRIDEAIDRTVLRKYGIGRAKTLQDEAWKKIEINIP